MEEPGFDFSHLPTDALHVVLRHVFAPPPEQEALPLTTVVRRWQAVRLTCKHWNEVLLAHPPPLHLAVSGMPEDQLPWVLSKPLRTLQVADGLDAAWSDGVPYQHTQAPLTAWQLVGGMEGAGLPAPFWSLATLTQLRGLQLHAPVSSTEQPAIFDSTAVEQLERLEALSLDSFADFKLDWLPGSLRRLRLGYDTQSRELSVPQLPDHVSLQELRIHKPGALGVCVDDIWGQTRVLSIVCRELLLGVPVADRRLVATFERPYREGNFVPPHIWGDEEADEKSKQAAEMTANHFLATLPSCPQLEHLRLVGGAATSAKFMPVLPRARDSLKWLWSVVRLQGLHNLYGLSGKEMEERQQMFGDQLQVGRGAAGGDHGQALETCLICVQRPLAGDENGEAA